MAPKMGLLRKFKTLEYTKHSEDSDSEVNLSVSSLGVELLAFEDEFRHKSLKFIVHSLLVRIN